MDVNEHERLSNFTQIKGKGMSHVFAVLHVTVTVVSLILSISQVY